MKKVLWVLFCLVAVSLAAEPAYYSLDDFLKGAERNPNRCVSNGDTYKCAGYENLEGAIFNVKTKHYFAYIREGANEIYVESLCNAFYVEEYENGMENIVCGSVSVLQEISCFPALNMVNIGNYDELGILVDENVIRNADVKVCRDAFHFQYGNGRGDVYEKIANLQKSVVAQSTEEVLASVLKKDTSYQDSKRVQPAVKMQNTNVVIGDGLAGPLGNNGAEKAEGSVKTPSERDIEVVSDGNARTSTDIMRVVRQRTPGLRHIYNKLLKRKPGFKGKVSLKFVVAPDGYISGIRVVSSTTNFSEFDNEIKTAVSRWKFSRIKSGNTTVTIPFNFSE